MPTSPKRVAFSVGEPAGIGPDIAIMLAQDQRDFELVAIADPELLLQRAKQLGLALQIRNYEPDEPLIADQAGVLCVKAHTLTTDAVPGQLDQANVPYLLSTLRDAVNGCLSGQFDALVTAPVHKGVINDSGVAFSGHTEFIADITGGHPVMMLLNSEFRVALATTHIPVSAIAQTLSEDLISDVVKIIHNELQDKFGINKPHILVCGLNPHAGENGHLGREEIEIIQPAIERCAEYGIHLTGPLPADTAFTPTHLDGADAVLAMYHDQGLPVLKYAGFGSAVNLTLGIPIIRTSVDHGTALHLAGTGEIDTGSAEAAVSLALELINK